MRGEDGALEDVSDEMSADIVAADCAWATERVET
jgi:hypothetical protein